MTEWSIPFETIPTWMTNMTRMEHATPDEIQDSHLLITKVHLTKVTRHQDEECEAEAERVEDEKARTPPRRRAQSHHRDEQREETTTCISFFSFLQNQEIPLTKGNKTFS